MAINTSKTKVHAHSKPVNPLDCIIVFNANEPGKPVNLELVFPIERVHNEGPLKRFNRLGIYVVHPKSN